MSATHPTADGSQVNPWRDPAFPAVPAGVSKRERAAQASPLELVMTFVASLKVTVVLFALAIFVIFVGTLAQTQMDIWEVMDKYFRAWVMWMDVNIFFPPSFFPNWKPVDFWPIPAPGGMFVGVAMLANLAAAHAWRFKLQAKGNTLLAGIVVLVVGYGLTAAIVVGGNLSGVSQPSASIFTPDRVWLLFQLCIAAAWLTVVSVLATKLLSRERNWLNSSVRVMILTLAAVAAYSALSLALVTSYLRPEAEGMRILWQLIQGTIAGLILLAGFYLLFGKRAGVVLLHTGLALMMLSELLVSRYAVEWQVSLQEGQTTNFFRDIRTVELALVQPQENGRDKVIVIPRWLLEQNYSKNKALQEQGKPAEPIRNSEAGADQLPLDVTVLQFLKNSETRKITADDKQLATAGQYFTSREIAVEKQRATGTDMSGGVDLAAAYVQFTEKGTGKDLGVYLLTQEAAESPVADADAETIKVGDQSYELALRFQREYKPYKITLVDVRKDDYLGTNTPKNYSSDVLLENSETGTSRKIHIKMNDPLRYDKTTFYQSGYAPASENPVNPLFSRKEMTTLAVVKNLSWMLPYISCMIVAVGLFFHFGQTLAGFFLKMARELETKALSPQDVTAANTKKKLNKQPVLATPALLAPSGKLDLLFGNSTFGLGFLIASIIFALFVIPPLYNRKLTPADEFGRLAVNDQGRLKPFDTLARVNLVAISGREVPKVEVLETKEGKVVLDEETKLPKVADVRTLQPTQWLLDLISEQPIVMNYRIFKIDDPELVKLFEIEPNSKGLYAIAELRDKMDKFDNEASAVEKKRQAIMAKTPNAPKLTSGERKIYELRQRIGQFMKLTVALTAPSLPPLPSLQAAQSDPGEALNALKQFVSARESILKQTEVMELPRTFPLEKMELGEKNPLALKSDDKPLQPLSQAWADAMWNVRILGKEPNPSVVAFQEMSEAYSQARQPELLQLSLKADLKHLKTAKQKAKATSPAEWQAACDKLKQQMDDFNEPLAKKQATFVAAVQSFEKTRRMALREMKFEEVNDKKLRLEQSFFSFSPFYIGAQIYVVIFLLAMFTWLFRSAVPNQTAFCLLVMVLVLHTIALCTRMYISGRPPVTNLYESAVFIAWGAVIFAVALEWIFRLGIGSALGGIAGFAGLLISILLPNTGDTIGVLQAVLDTRFWLATHVTLITFGYVATYTSGILGLMYVVLGMATPHLTKNSRKDLANMIYGVTCFAIIFSFVGTVLGGLWADDSWGRFWGWDPKENGALIIVFWNALILHARWDKMVGDRGLALLAIGGNIVTSWSWFGVNELGIGLHSYGFTEGVLLALLAFVASQVAIILVGLLPTSCWWSYVAERERPNLDVPMQAIVK